MKVKESKDFSSRIETELTAIYTALQVGEPTRKIRKIFAKTAKKVGKEIKAHLKDEARKAEKKKKADLKALKKKQQKNRIKSKPLKTGKTKGE